MKISNRIKIKIKIHITNRTEEQILMINKKEKIKKKGFNPYNLLSTHPKFIGLVPTIQR